MKSILRYRARRFHALYRLLTGETRSNPRIPVPDYLAKDLDLPEPVQHTRPPIHQGAIPPRARP